MSANTNSTTYIGIKDVATSTVLTVNNGNVSVDGSLSLTQGLAVGRSLETQGDITVRNSSLVFNNRSTAELNGKGLLFTAGPKTKEFTFRADPDRFFSTDSLEFAKEAEIIIDSAPVLSSTTLGNTVVNSNLRKVGRLKKLSVDGDTDIGEFFFVKPNFNRVGINTDQPNGALSVIEIDAELVLGQQQPGRAVIGTYTNHSLDFIVDNNTLISLNNNKEVVFGSDSNRDATVRINGVLYVDNVITSDQYKKAQSLNFIADADETYYGKGLIWSGIGNPRQFVYQSGPDRIYSSENIDLETGKYFTIGRSMVLSQTVLGSTITESSLTKVGILRDLETTGELNVDDSFFYHSGTKSLRLLNGSTELLVYQESGKQIIRAVRSGLSIQAENKECIGIDTSGNVTIGTTNKQVKVSGKLGVGVNTVDEDVMLSVGGNVKFANKKFSSGTDIPTSGLYNKGDIVWNANPNNSSYIGWVCVVSGTPGQWEPFGYIGAR